MEAMNAPSTQHNMYFAVLAAVPKGGTPASTQYAGARIACWIDLVDIVAARKRAVSLAESSGWHTTGFEDERIISAEDCPSRQDGMKYFTQALTDGEVCVIYTFPK